MAITFHSDGAKIPDLKRLQVKAWIKQVVRQHEKKTGDIAYIFCSEKKIVELNQQYLRHNYVTDIITFDYSEKNAISGDIFISIDTVRENATDHGTTFSNELNRVMIHGILHLCGINDRTAEEKAEMRRKEEEGMRRMRRSEDATPNRRYAERRCVR